MGNKNGAKALLTGAGLNQRDQPGRDIQQALALRFYYKFINHFSVARVSVKIIPTNALYSVDALSANTTMNDIKLPKNIPIFPLKGVLLLPGGILPLNIFEQRYLQMFKDALEGNCIIGMIQPSSSQPNKMNTHVYTTGCTGKITHHEDTSDGRMLVTLHGLCRFNIVEEHDHGHLYRSAEVAYLPSGNIFDENANADKHQRLLNAAALYLPTLENNIHLEPLLEASMSELVTVLAMHCPFSSKEKQSLLEAEDQNLRVDLLIKLLEQAALNSWPSGNQTVN